MTAVMRAELLLVEDLAEEDRTLYQKVRRVYNAGRNWGQTPPRVDRCSDLSPKWLNGLNAYTAALIIIWRKSWRNMVASGDTSTNTSTKTSYSARLITGKRKTQSTCFTCILDSQSNNASLKLNWLRRSHQKHWWSQCFYQQTRKQRWPMSPPRLSLT